MPAQILMKTHTHTDTHIHAHIHKTYTHVSHIHTHIHARTHARTHTHTHTSAYQTFDVGNVAPELALTKRRELQAVIRMYVCMYVCMIHTCMHACMHTCMHQKDSTEDRSDRIICSQASHDSIRPLSHVCEADPIQSPPFFTTRSRLVLVSLTLAAVLDSPINEFVRRVNSSALKWMGGRYASCWRPSNTCMCANLSIWTSRCHTYAI